MTDKLQLICFGIFLMAYYYFVLRKYNTLGFRMFSLFFFIGCSVCYWWYTDHRDLKAMQETGITTQALVLKKSADNLTVRFTNPAGQSIVRTQMGGISVDEFATLTEGQPASILYSPQSDTVYLTSSYQRQFGDHNVILGFAGVLFLIGSLCWIFLYKYRVHAYEDGSIYEYVTDENGKVVLDDVHNGFTQALRHYSTMWKLFDFIKQ